MNNEWHILFCLIFNFCRIELIIGRLTSFDMTNVVLYFLKLISVLFSTNNVLKKCYIIIIVIIIIIIIIIIVIKEVI